MSMLFTALVLLAQEALCSQGFSVPQVRSSNQLPNSGPAALARAYTKYGVPVSNSLAKRAAAQLDGQTGTSSATLVDNDIMYATPVTIGGQTFNMQLDTGSSDIWMFSTFTPEELRGANRHVYDPSLSSTAQLVVNETFSITYGSGYASGIVYTDTVSIGDLVISSQAVGATSNVSASFYNDPSVDGILGLSLYAAGTSLKPTKYPIFTTSILSALEEPLFAASLNLEGPGFYTFGAIPPEYPAESISWVPTTQSWATTITGYAIANATNMTTVSLGPIVDTGTPFLLLAPPVVEAYYESVGPVGLGTYISGENGMTYPCNETLPDLYLQIGNYTARISGAQLEGPPIDGDYCWGKVQPIAGPYVPSAVLGDTFLQSTFTIFKLPVNGSTPMLGFAHKDPSPILAPTPQ